MQHNMQALQRENALLQAQAQELRQNTALLGGNLQVRHACVCAQAGLKGSHAIESSCGITAQCICMLMQQPAWPTWEQRHGLMMMPARQVDVGNCTYKPRYGDTA